MKVLARSSALVLAVALTTAVAYSQTVVAERHWGTVGTDYFLGPRSDGTDLLLRGGTTRRGTGADVILLKVTTSGAFVWGKMWSLGLDDAIDGLALDSTGNAYLAGRTESLGSAEDAFLLSYAPNGMLLWQKAWGGPQLDSVCGVAVDSAGDVYAGGGTGTHALNGGDALLLKYRSNGTFVWAKTWDAGPGDSFNAIRFVPGPNGGSIYGAGNTINLQPPFTGVDVLLIKYDTSGAMQWARSWGGPGKDDAFGLSVNETGDVYVWGGTDSGAGGQIDMVVVKWDAQGVKQWELTWGGAGDDEAEWVYPVAGGGSFYLIGSTPQCSGTGTDVLIAFFDELPAAPPQLKWARVWGGAQDDILLEVHVEGNRLYAGGLTETCLGAMQQPCAGLIAHPNLGINLVQTQTGTPLLGALVDPSGADLPLGDAGCSMGPDADAVLVTLEVPLGHGYGCGPTQPNSTGLPGVLLVTGSPMVAMNDVVLTATQLPSGQFGYFLTSMTQGFFNPMGSSGYICLGGDIGRYNGNVGQGPSFSLQIDLTNMPVNPPVAVQPGETWGFQAWYRDVGNTNNFTDAVAVTFE